MASKALQAMAGLTALQDITLQANAHYIAGSDEELGTATLMAKACSAGLALQPLGGTQGGPCGTSSLVTLNLTNGTRQEIRNGPAGVWSGPDGTPHAMAQHNTLVPATWFFPALVLAEALNDPWVQLAYVGQETKGGVAVAHLQFWKVIPSGLSSDAAMKLFEHLTSGDVYLAAASSLPVALDFNLHPDNNAGLDIPVEIQYSNYQKMSGMLLPAHVQKLMNNSLLLDLSIASAAVNSGLPGSDFNVAPQSASGKAPPGMKRPPPPAKSSPQPSGAHTSGAGGGAQ